MRRAIRVAALLAVSVVLLHSSGTWSQDGPPACSPDTRACMTSCVNAGLTSDPLLDCTKSCGQFNSDYNGYCYARPYANQPLSKHEREAIYRQEANACTASECDPAYHQQLQACMKLSDKTAKISCSKPVIQEDLRCAAACDTRALRKAMAQ